MSLFDPRAVPETPVQADAAKRKRGEARTSDATSGRLQAREARRLARLGRRFDRCAEVVGTLEPGSTLHVVSAGERSAHDVIAHVVPQIGPAKLWIVTWSISDDAIRILLRMREAGALTSIRAAFDWRVQSWNPQSIQLAHAAVDKVATSEIHAKAYFLRSETRGVSIIGSANLTNNPRVEVCTITDDVAIADWHIAWIEQLLCNAKPFGALKKLAPGAKLAARAREKAEAEGSAT